MESRDYLSSMSVTVLFSEAVAEHLPLLSFFPDWLHLMLDIIPLPSHFHWVIPWLSHLAVLYWHFNHCREPRIKQQSLFTVPRNFLPLFINKWSFSLAMSLWTCPSPTTILLDLVLFSHCRLSLGLFWKTSHFPFSYADYFRFHIYFLS